MAVSKAIAEEMEARTLSQAAESNHGDAGRYIHNPSFVVEIVVVVKEKDCWRSVVVGYEGGRPTLKNYETPMPWERIGSYLQLFSESRERSILNFSKIEMVSSIICIVICGPCMDFHVRLC